MMLRYDGDPRAPQGPDSHEHTPAERAMEEAALLPEDDPRRREVVEGLGVGGAQRDSLDRAWLDILAENEALRLRLRSVDPPAGMLERLSAGPRAPRSAGRAKPRRWRSLMAGGVAVAAMVMVTTVAAVWAFVPWGQVDEQRASPELVTLATLAAMDHTARPQMAIETDDLDTLAAALGESLPYEFGITSPQRGAVLLGGRVCSFGERPLAYTCWRVGGQGDGPEGGQEVAVYQVRRDEFGLAAHLPPQGMDVPARGSRESQCRTTVWTDAEFGYVLVRGRASPAGL